MPGNEDREHSPIKQVMQRQITAKLLMATALIAFSALHETIQARVGIAQAHIPPVYEWCNAYYKPSANGNFAVHPQSRIRIAKGRSHYNLRRHKGAKELHGNVIFGPMDCSKASDLKRFVTGKNFLSHQDMIRWSRQWNTRSRG